jgi:hypothetical protein
MKRAAIALLFGLSAFAVQAELPAAAPEAAPGAAQAAEEETTVISADAIAARDTGCVRDTGTRIAKRDEKGCTGAPGNSFNRDDIDRSGAVTTAEAVRKLSPRASVQRGN